MLGFGTKFGAVGTTGKGYLAQLVAWLLVRRVQGTPAYKLQGLWFGDRVCIPGDEGESADLYDEVRSDFADITIRVFGEWSLHDDGVAEAYWRSGHISDGGYTVVDPSKQRDLADRRAEQAFPYEVWLNDWRCRT